MRLATPPVLSLPLVTPPGSSRADLPTPRIALHCAVQSWPPRVLLGIEPDGSANLEHASRPRQSRLLYRARVRAAVHHGEPRSKPGHRPGFFVGCPSRTVGVRRRRGSRRSPADDESYSGSHRPKPGLRPGSFVGCSSRTVGVRRAAAGAAARRTTSPVRGAAYTSRPPAGDAPGRDLAPDRRGALQALRYLR